jgi:hypothetical protein
MMLLFLTGFMVLCGWQRQPWWVPSAAAAAFIPVQIGLFYSTIAPRWSEIGLAVPTFGGVIGNALVASLPINLAVFYAAYGIGRGIARWRKDPT